MGRGGGGGGRTATKGLTWFTGGTLQAGGGMTDQEMMNVLGGKGSAKDKEEATGADAKDLFRKDKK